MVSDYPLKHVLLPFDDGPQLGSAVSRLLHMV